MGGWSEREPEAEHDGLRPWGAISLKDTTSQKETTGQCIAATPSFK